MTASSYSEAVDPAPAGVDDSLLDVRGLTTYFDTRDGLVKAVDGVDFHVNRGEVLGIVGESGCGKSVTSLSLMGLIPHPGKVVAGEIIFNGQNVAAMKKSQLRRLRGEHMSMIFQQPTSALNPVHRAGLQIKEVFELHRDWTKELEEERVVEMLAKVGIPDPGRRALAYPHELSGGMAQRVMIAMALACEPELLIADEPTTALDVTIQAQILDLMRDLQASYGTAVILITHDLGVVAEMADRVAVMYAGRIVEEAPVANIFNDPQHPYTKGLIGSIPALGKLKDRLATIPGVVPSLVDLPSGCRFAERCAARIEYGLDICHQIEPDLIEVESDHRVRCWLYQEDPNE